MPFDLGWDFRTSSGFVTDPAYAVFLNASTTYNYPFTFTNSNGDSINAGWVSGLQVGFSGDDNAGNDPRLAGAIGTAHTNGPEVFQANLGSGTAPGAGTYSIDIALGRDNDTGTESATVKDNTTVVLDLTNGGTEFATTTAHYIDATGANRNATTTWNGVTANVTFASTTCLLTLQPNDVSYRVYLTHFRLTAVAVAAKIPYQPWYQRAPILAQ